MNAAQLFVRCLENEGIDAIYGIPGEENIDLMDALRDSPIEFVLTRHEQAAAFMADVHGRLTGRAGVWDTRYRVVLGDDQFTHRAAIELTEPRNGSVISPCGFPSRSKIRITFALCSM